MPRQRAVRWFCCAVFAVYALGVPLSAMAQQDAAPGGVIHSPAEVNAAFAAVGLVLTPAQWSVSRAPEMDAQLRSEVFPKPALLGLRVATWASIEAMQALSAMPAVPPPPTGLLPLSAVSGNTATLLRAEKAQVHLPAYDWWCEEVDWVNSDGKRGPAAQCAPWDATGVFVSFGSPADPFHPTSLNDPLQLASSSPAHRVGVTPSGLNVYDFRFGGAASTQLPSRSSSAAIVAPNTGVRFPGTGWSCAARQKPTELVCYRTLDGKAETPILFLFPGRRILEMESVAAPTLQSTSTYQHVTTYAYEVYS